MLSGAAGGGQEIICRACPQAFYIETIYVIPLKKKGMVLYDPSVKEMCLKTSHLLMRERILEGEKNLL